MFLQCVPPFLYLRDCAPGTYFSYSGQGCAYFTERECLSEIESTKTTTTSTSTSDSPIVTTTESTTDSAGSTTFTASTTEVEVTTLTTLTTDGKTTIVTTEYPASTLKTTTEDLNTSTQFFDTTESGSGFCPDSNCTIGLPCDDGSTWSHEADCRLYWRCSTHVCLCLLECEEGFFFDPKRDKCRPEQEVDCDVVSCLRNVKYLKV
jgi:hypothetical protein